jgi:hypothetical protein
MTNNKYINPLIHILCYSLVFSGCSNAKNNKLKQNDFSNIASCHIRKNFELKEYLIKVSKRILLVSDKPDLNLNFNVKEYHKEIINIDKNGTITISRKALEALRDESQLATIIGYSIIQSDPKYKNIRIFNSEQDAVKYDQQNIINLSKAGYNPLALIELQEIINKNNWLSGIFLQPMTTTRIEINKNFIRNLPNGSLRTEYAYQKILGLQD